MSLFASRGSLLRAFSPMRCALVLVAIVAGVLPQAAPAATLAIPEYSGPCRITEHHVVACSGRDHVQDTLQGALSVATARAQLCAVLAGNVVRCKPPYESSAPGKSADPNWTGLPAGIEVAAGTSHACALRTDGRVSCWGSGSLGQLGNGGTAASGPVLVDGLTLVAGIDAGAEHTCAIVDGSSVRCWGDGTAGQLGQGAFQGSTTPVEVGGLLRARSVSAGGNHTCAVRTSLRVACWGAGSQGALGQGTTASSALPVDARGIDNAIAVAAGRDHSCVLRTDRTVACWGAGDRGQLGGGGTAGSLTPVPVPGLSNVTELVAGERSTCARTITNAVWCWGSFGVPAAVHESPTLVASQRVANTTRPSVLGPLQVGAVVRCDPGTWLGARAHAADSERANGVALHPRAWTYSYTWAPADGTATSAEQALTGVPTVPSDAGQHTVTARDVAEGLRCMVMVDSGDDRAVATSDLASGAPPESTVAAGEHHSCAVSTNGAVNCWGSGTNGRLGNGSRDGSDVPVPVKDLVDARQVFAGVRHSCALRAGGAVSCWGSNAYGQLGDGTSVSAYRPTPVTGLSDATALSVGSRHTCAIRAGGQVMCWGRGAYGRLGNGATADEGAPVPVTGLSDAVALAAGDRHTCAVRATGEVACWGAGTSGRLGNRASADAWVPVTVSALTDAVAVAVGRGHSCALRTLGRLKCWGANEHGQLGTGTTTEAWVAVNVPATGATALLPPATKISAGGDNTCLIAPGGRAACWGAGAGGRLGTGSTADALSPTVIDGLPDVTAISTGPGHSCARRAGGTASCWAEGADGELGSGPLSGGATGSDVPVAVQGLTAVR